ncbi:MAG: cyclase family protein [Bacteroidetes bacterium]|jgi:arylformamidase|nr:cyclase family protein [Bacteroidota bacterium]
MEPPKWIDITTGIQESTPVWPGDPAPIITLLASHEAGDDYQLSEAFFGLHTGTHIDAPLHFIPGAKDITSLSIEKMLGKVRVLDATDCKIITAEWLSNKEIQQGERLIFKTLHYPLKAAVNYKDQFTALELSAALFLAGQHIQLVGIDGLSIAVSQYLREVHVALLREEIIIVENLNLEEIEAGRYEMICLPIKISGTEAAPARVLLRKIP